MATSRSLGTLTIDLIAKIQGFTEGMSKAEREADRKGRDISRKQKERAKEVEKAWKDTTDNIGRILGTVGAAVAGGALFKKIATETANAQKEQALLAAALKATGDAAGYSLPRLNEMAGALESMTTFSAGEVNQAQTVLLGFTNIAGEQLPKALERAADFATRTGVSIASAAETMGRALDIPSAGMASLQRQGFKFSESQIELAKQLEQTGRLAEAQQLVFDALDETYGGAAVAARDTLGGAYTALQNTINSLLTGEGGSFRELQNSINNLTATLSSEQTRAAFATFTSWVASMANSVVQAAAVMNDAGLWGWLSVSNKETQDLQATYNEVSSTIQKLKKQRAELDPSKSTANKLNDWLFGDVGDLDRQIAALESKLKGVQSRLNQNSMPTGVAPSLVSAPDLPFSTPSSVNLKDGASRSKSAGKSQIDKDKEAADRYLKSLRDLAEGRREMNALEQLAYDIQEKRVKLSDADYAAAEKLASLAVFRADGLEREKEAQEALKRLMEEGARLTESLQTPLERYSEQMETLTALLEKGAIDQDTWTRAQAKYYEELTGISADYAKTMQENIQSALGDELAKGLDMSFKGIATSFLKMLLQMEAQALSANLMSALFGGGGTTKSPLVSLIGGLFGGGKATGGQVSRGMLYEVNEGGPEMLTVGGRDYLMTGSQAGYITPNAATITADQQRGGGNVTIVNQTTGRIDSVEERRVGAEDRVLIVQESVAAMRAEMQNPNSRTSRTMVQNFNTSRRRT